MIDLRMPRRGQILLGLLICLAGPAAATDTDPLLPESTAAYAPDLLARLRAAADDVPGARPTEVRYLKVAESHRPLSDVLEGGTSEPYVLARTAFQVVYPAGTIMIDSGMDREVHRFYGGGHEEPYWQDRNDRVQQALREANLIVITHEHGDHVAGVIRSPDRAQIAAKTILTRAQVETLVLAPQLPAIRLTPAMARDYRVIDYALFDAVAPGVVLLKAPGHTPGHQMVYVALASGAELMFIGDVAWAMDGVRQLRQKPPSQSARIREDRDAIAMELAWLKEIGEHDGVVVVPSHDQTRLDELERKGLLHSGLIAPPTER